MSRRGRRGGDRRSGQEYGENYLRYNRVCLWCGILFPTSRPDAKTDKPKCRVALARFVKRHGQPPLFPFGLTPDKKTTSEQGM